MIRKQKIAHAAYAVAFATAFVLIDWIEVVPYGFPDLDNYRYGFQSGWYLLHIINRSFIDFLLAEGVWVYLFDFIYTLVGDIDTVFLIVSLASIALMSFYVLGRTGSPLYLVFFMNPAFIDLGIGQIRSGFAAGIFWIAVYVKNLPLKLVLLAFAASIHTAFFVFGLFYIGFALFRRSVIVDRLLGRPVLTTSLIIGLALIVTVARSDILAALGDLRGYLFLEFSSGVFLSLAWISFAFTYIAWKDRPRMEFDGSFYAFCGSMAFFSAMIGIYGSRFSSVALPALAIMCSHLPPRYRVMFVIQYALFTGVYFAYWLTAQGRVV